jgi:hypothetical protein
MGFLEGLDNCEVHSEAGGFAVSSKKLEGHVQGRKKHNSR